MARRILSRGSCTRAAGLALVGLMLAACETTTVPPGVPVVDYEAAPHRTVAVESRSASHVVYLRSHGFSRPERERLAAFIVGVGGDRPESLRVSLRSRLGATALRQVAQLLVDDGVAPRNIVLSPAAAPPGGVVVAVERAVAALPACPGWVDHVSSPGDNRVEPNFGCSNATNIAAMVGDPHDLVAGQSNIYGDGQRGAEAVAAYRADKIKELPELRENFQVIPSGSGR